MLLTSDIPSRDLQGLNVKIQEKPLSTRMLDIESGPINCEFVQTLTYMVKNHDTEFYRNEEEWEFNGLKETSLHT